MSIERMIMATLKFDTALHIGAGKGDTPTDSPLRRKGDGKIFLPGRALGGSLRTLTTRLAPRFGMQACKALREVISGKQELCGCRVCQLFGELYPNEDDAEETGGAASRLWISDAFLQTADPQTHIRDGVGIGRSTGAAARTAKFAYEVVPRQAAFNFHLKLLDDESPAAHERAQLLAATLAEWQAGRGQLGASVARGLGRFHLENLHCMKTNLASADDLIAYLKADDRSVVGTLDSEWLQCALNEAVEAIDLPVARGFLTIEFTLALESPFLTNDPLAAMLAGFDHAPLAEVALTADHHAGTPMLSGASLRGALRSRAEKIARTLATEHWWRQSRQLEATPEAQDRQARENFLAHGPACDPFVKVSGEPLASCDKRLSIPDEQEVPEGALCLSCQLFGSPRRGSRLFVEDAHWTDLPLGPDTCKVQDFLAIDRFTGGGQEHAKFDAAPLLGARFSARLTLQNPRDWELGWLALILRDLAEGELTLGFGAAKGYGQARATNFKWSFGFLTPNDFPGAASLLVDPQPSGIYKLCQASGAVTGWLPESWEAQAQIWVEAFTQRARNFTPDAEWKPFQKDSFFDHEGQMLKLYGMPLVEVSRHE